jgi:hypothetical protein
MQISKLLPAICAVAFCASFISARADDTPSQAAARAALEAKMNALNAPQAPPDAIVSANGLQPAVTNDAAAAQQALDAKMAELNTPPPPKIPADASPAEKALDAKMAELNAPVKSVQTSAPASVTPASSEEIEKAKASLEQKMSQLNQQSPKPSPPAPVVAAPTPAKPAAPEIPPAAEKPLNPASVNYPGKTLGLKPIAAPPLPISADKQAQLQALDAKYMANQITPEEYHKQRAEILGLPDEMSH